MTISVEERERCLDNFLTRWPASRLGDMTLAQYTGSGDKDTFSYWTEFGAGRYLGSNAGGDASKFGIYKRGADARGQRNFISADAFYSWKNKYGNSAQEAFENIKQCILTIADAAQKGDLETIQNMDFELSLKWKVAFIYQDHAHPCVLPIYKLEKLRDLVNGDNKTTHSAAYTELLSRRMGTPALEYGIGLWRQSDASADDAEQEDDTVLDDEVMPATHEPQPVLNQILYGPPGTGKTWNTVNKALEILDPQFLAQNSGSDSQSRARIKARFDTLIKEDRIDFVTFHQSFSYEDFVEGIRARVDKGDDEESGQLSYIIEDGVFKMACNKARRDRSAEVKLGIDAKPRIWKISIEEVNSTGATRQYCFDNGEARIGWGHVGDLTHAELDNPAFNLGRNDRRSLAYFSREAKEGDILLCLASMTEICAVGVVSGPYRFDNTLPPVVRSDFKQVLPVNWLLKEIRFNILQLNGNTLLRPMTMYPLDRIDVSELFDALRSAGHQLPLPAPADVLPNVLIIDEINRGNISRIFGELITLIEPSKRQGGSEALEVTLPYSKKRFSVPENLWIIGTMNTADRSLAGLDIALRRRFTFIEMLPDAELLNDVTVRDGESSINVGALLAVMNQRIEVLLDRDRCLGHAYFMPLKADPSLPALAFIFRNQIIPLLQEYFFEDWERISWVLNGHAQKNSSLQFIRQAGSSNGLEALFGTDLARQLQDRRWTINEAAFCAIDSYRAILGER